MLAMKILALVPGNISDQILFFPALSSLHNTYPQAAIDLVIEPAAADAYQVCPRFNNLIKFSYSDSNSLADFGDLLGQIREREYSLAFSYDQQWSTSLLLWLSGIPTRIGSTGSGGAFFYSKTIQPDPAQYQAIFYHDFLRAADVHQPCPPLNISIAKTDLDWAARQCQELGIKGGYIAIANDGPTPYPVAQWLKIVQDLHHKQPNMPILLLANPEGQQWVGQMLQSSADVKVAFPERIGQLAALVAGAKLLLCPETPVMHLAVAVNTYVIALVGSTPIGQILPAHGRNIGIQSPTGAIADISAEQVLEQVWRG